MGESCRICSSIIGSSGADNHDLCDKAGVLEQARLVARQQMICELGNEAWVLEQACRVFVIVLQRNCELNKRSAFLG